MPKKEAPLSKLQDYLPPGTFETVLQYLRHYHVHLTITRERKSILGDYRHRTHNMNHRISVNGDLNPFSFLITLLHELAHLLTFEQHGNRVQPHGREWKFIFGRLLSAFLDMQIFPDDIRKALLHSIKDPSASSCADDMLLRILKKYDRKHTGMVFVENIPEGQRFRTSDGRIFTKGIRLRKRFRCEEVNTRRVYLFSPLYEAMIIPENEASRNLD